MAFKNSDEFCREKEKEALALIKQNGHIFLSGTYKNRESSLLVYCTSCDLEISTTYYNYMRSKTGCLICGRKLVSEALTNRVFSEETLDRMRIANNQRPNRGDQPRRWRENHQYRSWRNRVLVIWNNECAITGEQNSLGEANLSVHHLISASSNQDLAYNENNGIVVSKTLHTLFHNTFGYRNNNISQFKQFILSLINSTNSVPISSQGESEGSQGSETRVYDPERIMKLHERLGKIEKENLS